LIWLFHDFTLAVASIAKAVYTFAKAKATMNLQTYINTEPGNATRLVSVLGIPLSYLSQMASGYRNISPSRALSIERATGGLVTRKEMRPDDCWLIWPDIPAPIAEVEAA